MEEPKEKSLKVLRLRFLVINLIFLVTAYVVISKITTLESLFGKWYYFFWYTQFDIMAYLWISGGWALLTLSIVGIILIISESAKLYYIYAVTLSFLSIYQIGVAFASFSFTTLCGGFAWNRILVKIIRDSDNEENRNFLNFIQSTYKCCGIIGPSDFLNGTFAPFWVRYITQLPQSCYVNECNDFGYCGAYYTRGCYPVLKGVILDNVILTGVPSLIIGFGEILAAICAIMVANEIKRKITNRTFLLWNSNQNPTYGSTGKGSYDASEAILT